MRRLGDRKDAKLLRDIDGMHYFMPVMFLNRCDSEAYMTMEANLEKIEDYIKEKNADRPEEEQLSVFGLVITAILRTIYERPQMNRFIANKNLYQRNDVSCAFVVKKDMNDEGEENLARVVLKECDTLDMMQKKINEQITFCKTFTDPSSEGMNKLKKLHLKRFIGMLARFADRHGLMPKSLCETDPYQNSVVITNLGSIGLNIGYHHLTNWGTTSIFLVMGKKNNVPEFSKSGEVTMKRVLKLSYTVDERISDGFYFSKSLRLMKKYLENPELLQKWD